MTTSTEPVDSVEPASQDDAGPAHPAFVRIPTAILAAFVVASVAVSAWAFLVSDHVPRAVDEFVGVLLLFAAAPILAAVFLRGSRLWVRVLVGIFSAWIWVFWLFLVLVPVTS
jgi:hypothetical protein